MVDQQIRKALCEQLTVSVEVAALAFDLSGNSAYDACNSGQIPCIRFGKRIVVPTAPLRKMLGIEVQNGPK